ncbi:MAG TPA: Holliday junction resolvase RuvX [Candidatus Saccharimonadales bacterium]|nr:Holliday junction resolvase RuvX [Candidatus Saccharimonadales bacterium]
MAQDPSTVIALDVGARRIGVAIATQGARLARPLTTLLNTETILSDIQQLIQAQHASMICVGLPRGLDGQETQQTRTVQAFAAELQQTLSLPINFQDEAVTSRQAEAELQARGKPYAKGDIDALAATYILEDFLRDHKEVLAA